MSSLGKLQGATNILTLHNTKLNWIKYRTENSLTREGILWIMKSVVERVSSVSARRRHISWSQKMLWRKSKMHGRARVSSSWRKCGDKFVWAEKVGNFQCLLMTFATLLAADATKRRRDSANFSHLHRVAGWFNGHLCEVCSESSCWLHSLCQATRNGRKFNGKCMQFSSSNSNRLQVQLTENFPPLISSIFIVETFTMPRVSRAEPI